MVELLIGVVFCYWVYKLLVIIRNSRELTRFSEECEALSRRDNSETAKKLKAGGLAYKKANKKITTSNIVWFLVEVIGLSAVYFVFIH
ncbi:hypothetical protein LV716_09180 [Flagellimonas sp. HMM57]|uniref:hypothetical protein n=1 Tax=unclassified Flagellimonas TaxID=2644544 RepID=UPI0013CFE57D|nr:MULTISPECIES: hypothetical protein [unclassified Flagellimonas]UII77926.1 hypothetical protein LV716_09180 [Flagellimonas sp. HMM57]